jgi:hypothetical protein
MSELAFYLQNDKAALVTRLPAVSLTAKNRVPRCLREKERPIAELTSYSRAIPRHLS